MELSNPKVKKILIFFRNSFSFISENRTFQLQDQKFQEGTFWAQKNPTLKKLVIYQKIKLSSLKILKKLLYLRRELAKSKKQQFLIFL